MAGNHIRHGISDMMVWRIAGWHILWKKGGISVVLTVRKAKQAHKEKMRYNGEALVGMGGETGIFCYSVFCGTAVI